MVLMIIDNDNDITIAITTNNRPLHAAGPHERALEPGAPPPGGHVCICML